MSTEADSRELLPIACTLDPDDGAQRIADWRQLGATFGLGRLVGVGEITVRFRHAAGVEEELERLVAAERICCPFLRWTIASTPTDWQLVINGDEDALKALLITL